MFAGRHVIEGSIEHRIALMSREERLARADQLLESAVKYLPVLEQHEKERAEAEADAAHDDETSGAQSTEG
jgi:hypothetical protein